MRKLIQCFCTLISISEGWVCSMVAFSLRGNNLFYFQNLCFLFGSLHLRWVRDLYESWKSSRSAYIKLSLGTGNDSLCNPNLNLLDGFARKLGNLTVEYHHQPSRIWSNLRAERIILNPQASKCKKDRNHSVKDQEFEWRVIKNFESYILTIFFPVRICF